MELVVILCGIYCIGLAIFHIAFWKIFSWKTELPKMSVANRAIIQIANLRLIYLFLFFAAICFLFPAELSQSVFGKFFMGGIALFWLCRFLEQFIFLRINHPLVHTLTVVFLIGSVLFALPVIA
jgi:hypothetical protein